MRFHTQIFHFAVLLPDQANAANHIFLTNSILNIIKDIEKYKSTRHFFIKIYIKN